jgi:hypothetical protein
MINGSSCTQLRDADAQAELAARLQQLVARVTERAAA